MSQETVSVPKETLVDHIVSEALETGIIEQNVTEIEVGRGESVEIDWYLDDVDEWDVHIEGDEIVLFGVCDGQYSVLETPARYNPPGKAHPAEYRNETHPIGVEIRTDWSEVDHLGAVMYAELL